MEPNHRLAIINFAPDVHHGQGDAVCFVLVLQRFGSTSTKVHCCGWRPLEGNTNHNESFAARQVQTKGPQFGFLAQLCLSHINYYRRLRPQKDRQMEGQTSSKASCWVNAFEGQTIHATVDKRETNTLKTSGDSLFATKLKANKRIKCVRPPSRPQRQTVLFWPNVEGLDEGRGRGSATPGHEINVNLDRFTSCQQSFVTCLIEFRWFVQVKSKTGKLKNKILPLRAPCGGHLTLIET